MPNQHLAMQQFPESADLVRASGAGGVQEGLHPPSHPWLPFSVSSQHKWDVYPTSLDFTAPGSWEILGLEGT